MLLTIKLFVFIRIALTVFICSSAAQCQSYFQLPVHDKRRVEYDFNFADSVLLLKSILEDNPGSDKQSGQLVMSAPSVFSSKRLRRPDFGLDRLRAGSHISSVFDATKKATSAEGPG
ncbi:uncharacterized protein LOC129582830 [Paramacrobiotus metropolitanus]|uniref:uncharacterized protein LOC129582830 n=1 Tax=Paramacrobiotus metropolitanus TaxID=2943436 RepID=UPI002445A0AB|nr:uncharacterized protein LOC129582830 [Paramacrobiotus metropolitanus]